MINDILSLIEVATIAKEENGEKNATLKWNYDLRDQGDDLAIPIKFDNIFKSSDEGKGISQKCDARSEFLFLLVKAIAFYFLLSVVVLREAWARS